MNQQQSDQPFQALADLGVALHDLCQPLTTLQCRMEMAQLLDSESSYREAVTQALAECARLTECVVRMRQSLRSLTG